MMILYAFDNRLAGGRGARFPAWRQGLPAAARCPRPVREAATFGRESLKTARMASTEGRTGPRRARHPQNYCDLIAISASPAGSE